MNLTSTYNSIGIELFFTGDDNMDAIANLEFKRSGESNWHQGLPLWGTYEDPRAFYGSALLLDAGTAYDIRISFNDPDGVNGNFLVAGSVATQAEDIPAANALSPTHYVSPQGNDSQSGTSAGNAWKTLDKAVRDAPAGAVVLVAPGSYEPPLAPRATPLTLVAAHAAVGDDQQIVNAGLHSVIEPQTMVEPRTGTWEQVTLTGPVTGEPYSVWRWANAPVANITQLNISLTRDAAETPTRVVRWSKPREVYDGYTLQTPEGWAEALYLNINYRYGYTTFDNDVYMRLPGDQNPNDFYTWIVSQSGDRGAMQVQGPNVRYSGFEMRMTALNVKAGSTETVIDHNLIYNGTITFEGDKKVTPMVYPTDITIEHNRMLATGFFKTDTDPDTMPWLFIKGTVKVPGASKGWHGVGKPEELAGTAIWGRGNAQRLVVRHNTIDGYFNGISGYNTGFDRYPSQDTDIHDNLFRHIADDALEPERDIINWRIWNNRIEDVTVALSTGPVAYGPVYFFRNEIWRVGHQGLNPTVNGVVGSSGGYTAKIFKFSHSSNPTARLYVISNTFWTDQPYVTGGSPAAGGGGSAEGFYLRNNIVVVTRYVIEGVAVRNDRLWDENYNHFYTDDPKRGLGDNLTIEDYREKSGEGSHSNLAANVHDPAVMSFMIDPASGNIQLSSGSPLVDAGVVVPNIAESFNGSAPDLGATER